VSSNAAVSSAKVVRLPRRRRSWVTLCGCGAVFAGLLMFAPAPSRPGLSMRSDSAFLDEIEWRAFRFFRDHTDPATGLTRDRAPSDGSPSRAPASIAASGFALTAWCVGVDRGWIDGETATQHALTLLRSVDRSVAQEHGWIYHFVDIHSGARMWRSEASTIDTALFLQGALLAREYLDNPEVSTLVNRIYARIDWVWALNGGRTLSHGWRPPTGFLTDRWDSYSELLGLYLLGIGAPVNPLPAECWGAWRREPVAVYGTHTFINSPALFTHQYSHAWFDFRGMHDQYVDYWENSVEATLAQREWCATLSTRFNRWSSDLWGLTASDSTRGYVNWGGPEGALDGLDGTVVPSAPAGSLPFAPQECLIALRRMLEVGGSRVWGRYGFADAFNPQTGWVSTDVIAIDMGITLAMAENLRSGFCWTYFMRAPESRRAFALTGFERESPGRPFDSPVLEKAVRESIRIEAVPGGGDAAMDETLPGPRPFASSVRLTRQFAVGHFHEDEENLTLGGRARMVEFRRPADAVNQPEIIHLGAGGLSHPAGCRQVAPVDPAAFDSAVN
jgi:hypothetical protein